MAMSFAILPGVIVRERGQSGRAAAFADVERSAWARLAWIGGSRRFGVRVWIPAESTERSQQIC